MVYTVLSKGSGNSLKLLIFLISPPTKPQVVHRLSDVGKVNHLERCTHYKEKCIRNN